MGENVKNVFDHSPSTYKRYGALKAPRIFYMYS